MNTTRSSPQPFPRPRIGRTPYPFFFSMVKQTLLIVAVVGLFLGGLLSGHFATTAWPGLGNCFSSNQPLDAVVLDKLKSELRLTPAQTAQVAPVITAACSEMRLLSEEGRSRRLALLDEVGATIAPELSPAQQRRLEAVEAEWQKHPPLKRDQRIVALF